MKITFCLLFSLEMLLSMLPTSLHASASHGANFECQASGINGLPVPKGLKSFRIEVGNGGDVLTRLVYEQRVVDDEFFESSSYAAGSQLSATKCDDDYPRNCFISLSIKSAKNGIWKGTYEVDYNGGSHFSLSCRQVRS